MSIYNFEVKTREGKKVSLSQYEGKVVVIVNTASKCGLAPQLKQLEDLHHKYSHKDLAILGFPCGQFGGQELKGSANISEYCEVNFGVTFQLFDKIDVNGKNEHPLFTYLKEKQPTFLGRSIKWNFTKFLVDKNGNVVKRYAPPISPKKMEKRILHELGK